MQALSDSKANEDERRQIRELLDSLDTPGSPRLRQGDGGRGKKP
jgi:hypothetical protein